MPTAFIRLRLCLPVLLLVLTACRADRYFPPPAIGEAQSLLFVLESEAGQATLFAASADEPLPLLFDSAYDDRAFVFLFRQAVGAIQLGPGVIELRSGNTRPLPDALVVLAFDGGAWNESNDRPTAELGLPAFDYPRCFGEGGCAPLDGEPDRCQLPCAEPMAVAAPALPQSPCPPGWPEQGVDELGLPLCKPIEPALAACPAGQRQPLGQADCQAVSLPCSSGFPDLTGETRIVSYVDAYAPAGGDGTMARPMSDLWLAFELSGDNGVIAIAPGEYAMRAELDLRSGERTLIGACAANTIITAPTIFAVTLGAATLHAQDLSLAGSGVSVDSGGEFIGDRLVIDADVGAALNMESARAEISGSVLSAPTSHALQVTRSRLALRDSTVWNTPLVGVACGNGTVSMDRVRLIGSDPIATPGDEVMGAGVHAVSCSLNAQQLVIDHQSTTGVVTFDSMVRLEDVVVRDNGALGIAAPRALAFNRSLVTLERVLIERSYLVGCHTLEGSLTVTDMVIEGSYTDMPRGSAQSFGLGSGGIADVRRLRIEGPNHRAMNASGDNRLTLRDLIVHAGDMGQDTRARVLLADSSDVERVLIVESGGLGLEIEATEPSTLDDITVLRARSGMLIEGPGGNAQLQRLRLEDSGASGLTVRCNFSSCESSLISDVHIARTSMLPSVALQVGVGALLELDRFLIEGSSDVGLELQQGSLTSHGGRLEHNDIGMRVPADSSVSSRAIAGVRFRDNREDLRAAEPGQ